MVRAHMKQAPGEKKAAPKKSSSANKKKQETGSWPCKINGCNKVFAREADLKRHQRTTKLHSMPAFACPQCDATFTRTDALRRHQKSRHNGVIIEPAEPDKSQDMDGDGGSIESHTPSPRGTPARSHGDPGSAQSTPPSALAQPTTAGPASGPSTYYRQHTMSHAYSRSPIPPGYMMDPHYPPPPIGLPTSATRLHQTSWHPPPPPPWVGEGQVPPGHQVPPSAMYMPQGPYYSASPYYRHPGMVTHPQQPQAHPHVNMPQNGGHFQSSDGVQSVAHSAQSSPATVVKEVPESDRQVADAPPVIDPSLQKPVETSEVCVTNATLAQSNGANDAKDGWEIAQAAVQAVLDYEKAQQAAASAAAMASAAEQVQNTGPSQQGVQQMSQQSVSLGAAMGQLQPDANAQGVDKSAPQQQVRVPVQGMPQMMTEDGEPMLNPAELLTQESLASPPPS
ncbi:hypothetical protein OBBRIDRAFT_793952 [Obba rivulosa]|uniref:C2H2-type domain-containing protein n=1 Tax=Obba rivulosa TaxID=1052685 RepID=A0A8E2AST4_9APHY|nr:hypothetical protein OBBRIDRAFT_793952 [Obba rivulosa]